MLPNNIEKIYINKNNKLLNEHIKTSKFTDKLLYITT